MLQLGTLDVMRAVWWWSRALKGVEETAPGVKSLRIIDGDWQHPDLIDGKWGTLKHILGRARRISERNSYTLTYVCIEQVDAHTALPWITGLQEEAQVYVPLHVSRTVLIEDVAIAFLHAGDVWACGSNNLLRSFANHGDWPSVSLLMTLRREEEGG